MGLTVGSLFSGIGGLELGLERAGMAVRWQVESDPFCQRVLAKHWPDAPRYSDITTLDPGDLEPVDLICGGFPCQPVSQAGRRQAQADERWLWPHFARVLRHLRPRYALLENVPGLLNAPAGSGRAAQEVFGDLAELGFDAEWASVPAAAVGAPHLRYRVFIVAHARGQRRFRWSKGEGVGRCAPIGQQTSGDAGHGGSSLRDVPHAGSLDLRLEPGRSGGESGPGEALAGLDGTPQHVADAGGATVPDADSERLEERRLHAEGREVVADSAGSSGFGIYTRPPSGQWPAEPDVGRVAHGVPSRVDRLRALGNAVVPQAAEYVGRCIVDFDCRMTAAPTHPARFSKALLPTIAEWLADVDGPIIDPMAGVGTLATVIPGIYLNELEPEWSHFHYKTQGIMGIDFSRVTTLDARDLPYPDGFFAGAATSPCYGNRMADCHEPHDQCRLCEGSGQDPERTGPRVHDRRCRKCRGSGLTVRKTYRHNLGRPLSPGNTGGMQWGAEYRRTHREIWAELTRVLAPRAPFVLNISDHIRDGHRVPVTAWHIGALVELGYRFVREEKVTTPRHRFGAGAHLRVDHESLILFAAPARVRRGRRPAGDQSPPTTAPTTQPEPGFPLKGEAGAWQSPLPELATTAAQASDSSKARCSGAS